MNRSHPAGEVLASIIRDNVVLEQAGWKLVIPFPEWNELVERIGYRAPAEDRACSLSVGEVLASITGDNVVVEQAGRRLVIPFPEWNELVERIGNRTPTVDPEDGPP